MHGDYPANITAQTDHLDLDALWRAYLGAAADRALRGRAASITMQGPLRYPRQWTLKGKRDRSCRSSGIRQAAQPGPGELHLRGPDRPHRAGALWWARELTSPDTARFISPGTRELDLAADGQIDLKLLGSFDPDLTASGRSTVHMTVGGTLERAAPARQHRDQERIRQLRRIAQRLERDEWRADVYHATAFISSNSRRAPAAARST